MRWSNHKVVTFFAVYSMTGQIVAASIAMFGSLLPDVLEIGGVIRHRTITHTISLWCVACGAAWLLYFLDGNASLSLYILFFFLAGGLLHVFEDALSEGGVPLLTPFGRKVRLGVYKLGNYYEEVTAIGLVLLFGTFAYGRGFVSGAYIGDQVSIIVRLVSRVFTEL